MSQVHSIKAGLAVGGVLAVWHAAWAALVAMRLAKPFMDWVLSLHFISLDYRIVEFSFLKALTLVVFTFVWGYALGFIFSVLLNMNSRRI